MHDPINKTWEVHHHLNLAFIESIKPAALSSQVPEMSRTVGQVIAHPHNNRLSWLEHLAPDLFANLHKVPHEQSTDQTILLAALQASGEAIHQMLEQGLEHVGKLKAFPGPAAVFLGYMIAHDSYRHGEINLILTQTGHRMPRERTYRLWDW